MGTGKTKARYEEFYGKLSFCGVLLSGSHLRLISSTYSLIACSSERVQHPNSSGRHQGGQQEGGAGVQHLWAAEGVC